MRPVHLIPTVAAVLALSATAAFASEPGQPLDCSDWVVLDPGISCREIGSCGIEPTTGALDFPCQGLSDSNVDALGRVVDLEVVETVQCSGSRPSDLELKFFDGASEHLAAYVRARCVAAACADGVVLVGRTVDSVNGRVYAVIRQRSFNCDASPYDRVILFVFEGFPTTFEVLQSYTPQSSALTFRVPRMPEGFPAADHFDTYWGPLTKPIDFASAQSLACDYPAAAPAVGDYLEVPAAVPDPPAGQGYWYLTSVTYQGQTRFGRKASGGRLSGREPGAFPACSTAE